MTMGDLLGWIPEKTLFAIMTMSSGGIMAAIDANSTAPIARQLIKFHIKSAFAGMKIALAS